MVGVAPSSQFVVEPMSHRLVSAALVLKPDQTVEQRPVTIGIAYEGLTVVKQGLQAGEIVVTDGQLRLAPGVPVSVKNSGPPAAAAVTNKGP